jgi:hypothetical protein
VNLGAHLGGGRLGERRLPEAAGAREEDVAEGFAALAGGPGSELEVRGGPALADDLREALRAERRAGRLP